MRHRTTESRLATLRKSRSLPPDAGTVGELVRKQMAEIRSLARGTERAVDAWTRVAPPAIAKLARLKPAGGRGSGAIGGSGGGRGVLTLVVQSAASRFQVDRWLRGGGLALLREADPAIRSVKIVGSAPTHPK